MRGRLSAEFIGTFLLVFAGCGAIMLDSLSGGAISHVGVALTFGLIIMVMIYAVSHISGAHFNPAVTVAFTAAGHFPARDAAPYIAAQLAGAAAGALLLRTLLGSGAGLGMTLPNLEIAATVGHSPWLLAGAFEFVLTFGLMFVIMAVATDERAIPAHAAIAIGGTVALEALFAGPVCGASMNPARSFGPALAAGDFAFFPAYVVGPVLGALAGAFSYKQIAAR